MLGPPSLARPLRRPVPSVALLCVVYALLLVWLGCSSHPIEVAGGESDGYVHRAEQILNGNLPRDPYRPLFFPLLVAGAGAALGDCFVAGRIVSALLAGVMVFCAFGLVRSWFGTAPAVLAALLMMANGELAVHGTQVGTDVAFAAFVAGTLWACTRAAADSRVRAGILPGFGFALAWFTRYTAVALLLPVFVALCLPRGLPMRRRLARLGVAAGTATVCLIPHFVLTWMAFGSPVHDENWRSMAMKIYGDWDASKLEDSPLDGLWSVLFHEPVRILELGLHDLGAFFSQGAPVVLQGGPPPGFVGISCLILCGAGIARGIRERRGAVPLVFGLVYLLLVCFTFHPFVRLLLPILPVLCGAVAGGLLWPTSLPVVRTGRAARIATWGSAAALVALVASGLPARLALFAKQHPTEEVAAARRLVESRSEPFRLLASYASMSRYVPYPVDWIPILGATHRNEPDAYVRRIRERVEATGARFVLLGRRTTGDAMFDALRGREPPFLRRIEADDSIVLFEVVSPRPQWIAEFSVEPNPFSGGPLSLEVRLADGEHVEAIEHVVVGMQRLANGGDRGLAPVELPRVSSLVYRVVFEQAGLAPGDYRLTPAAFASGGRMSQGSGIVLSVR